MTRAPDHRVLYGYRPGDRGRADEAGSRGAGDGPARRCSMTST